MITLATLPEATEQEVFEQVSRHLLTQYETSSNGGSCKYKYDDLKCAAGCLIGPDEYSESLECNNWDELAIKDLVPMKHHIFIRKLQALHDSLLPNVWKSNLIALGKKYNLDTSFINTEF